MLENKNNFKSEWRYKCYTVFTENGVFYQVDDVKKPISWAEFLTNGSLYHDTLRDCIFNTMKPIIYHGVNINTWQPDIFLKMDGCGNFYRDYHFDDTNLKQFENIA